MTFLTYAQNFEDVLLWRALQHVKNGFYIDVGANDPELHSVTKAFYDAGWWGINIEPMPSYAPVFARERPRDLNLALAAGASDGQITLFDTPAVNGWASTDAGVAAAHRAEGVDVVEVQVPLRTLNSICAEHVRGDIHFLKIDVEGHEGDVLRGLDLARWRPWVLVVEATLPGSQQTNHASWEHLILPHGYQFAYFDGLNRYYVAAEHRELLDRLTVQANVFDAFISHHLDKAWKQAETLHGQVQQGLQQADASHQQALAAQDAMKAAQAQSAAASAQLLQAVARADEAVWQAGIAQNSAAEANRNVAQAQARTDEAIRNALQAQASTDAAQHSALQAQARAEQAARSTLQAQNRADAAVHSSLQALEAAASAARARDAARAEVGELKEQLLALQAQRHAEVTALHAGLAAQSAQLLASDGWGRSMEQRLLRIEGSWRWRLAYPADPLQRGANGMKQALLLRLRALVERLKQNQRARRLLLPLIQRYPQHAARVLDTVSPKAPPPPFVPEGVEAPAPIVTPLAGVPLLAPEELGALPQSVRQVLSDLNRVIRPPTP